MSGDVAKSTKYSTYAAAGVYGKPVLITPLYQDEITKLAHPDIGDKIFKNIKSAVKSAKRATLEVWGMDNLVNKINEKLNI